jgi:hypothetical protein
MKSLIILLALCASAALAHPGKKDAQGCHANARIKGEVHCHRPSAAASASDSFRLSDPPATEEKSDPSCIDGPRGVRYKMVNGQKKVC